jgi:predicted double-glycine peptidase
MFILDFPTLRQTYNYDCGAIALQSVLVYYGVELREDILLKEAGTTKRVGTPVRGLKRVARKHGFSCQVKQMTIEQVIASIKKKKPVILLLQAWTGLKKIDWEHDWVDGHYVVAIGFDEKNVYFEDPSSFTRTFLSFKELGDRWHDIDSNKNVFDHIGITLSKKRIAKSFHEPVHMD